MVAFNKNNKLFKKELLVVVLLTIIGFSFSYLKSINSNNSINSDNSYTITFKDYDGKVLFVQNVKEGEMPCFDGNIEREDSGIYEYKFLSWDKPINVATKSDTYSAVYSSSLSKNFTDKKFRKPNNTSETFEFYNDNEEVEPNEEDKEKEYLVTFVDDEGKVLQTNKFKYGTMPSFNGTVPKKKSNGYKYIFKSWSPTLHKVVADQKYVATYDKEEIADDEEEVTVTYIDASGVPRMESIVVGTNIIVSADSGSFVETGDKTITLQKNQDIDLTTDTYKPNKNNYIFIGYDYNSSNNKFTAQYISKPVIKYNDENSYLQTIFVEVGTNINVQAGTDATYQDGLTSKTIQAELGTSYDLTTNEYKPTKSGYTFIGYNKSSNTFLAQYVENVTSIIYQDVNGVVQTYIATPSNGYNLDTYYKANSGEGQFFGQENYDFYISKGYDEDYAYSQSVFSGDLCMNLKEGKFWNLINNPDAIPFKDGYTFIGYILDESNRRLTAQFVANG